MKKFDERQAILRGKIFMQIFFITAALLLLNAFLVDFGYNIAEGMWSYVFILAIPLSIGIIEMVWLDILSTNSIQKFTACIVTGLSGLVLFILSIIDLIKSGGVFFANKALSENGASLLIGIFYTGILVSFLLKLYIEKKEIKKM